MRIFLSLLPKYQNYTSVLASIIHLRSDAGFFVNPQRISETTQLPVFFSLKPYGELPAQVIGASSAPLTQGGHQHVGCITQQSEMS